MRTKIGLILLLCFIGANAGGERNAPAGESAEHLVQEVIERTNAERTKRGLPPLKQQPALTQAARWLARDMATKNYFEHKDRQGRDIDPRLPDFGYTEWRNIGENIAGGQRSAEGVVAGWMKSPGHRANILNPQFREIGVGYAVGRGRLKTYWVQDFGSRADEYPIIINDEAAQTRSPNVRLYLHGKEWAEEMRLSNDGTRWTDWQPFEARTDWTLPPRPGERTVFVELRRGDRVLTAQDSIRLLP